MDVNGKIIENEKEVLNQIKLFYTHLYSREHTEEDNDFFKHLPTLTTENSNSCEGKISEGECFSILKEMKTNLQETVG